MSSTPSPSDAPRERWLFVTGRLAEGVVRRVVGELAVKGTFTADVTVVGISVAALMHVEWLRRKLVIDGQYDRVMIPGWCQGDLNVLEEHFGVPFLRGPKDVLDLASFLGSAQRAAIDLTPFDIEIIAEINHAQQLSTHEIVRQALQLQQAGADVIDVGCFPGETWSEVGTVVRALRQAGCRVSIDSFNQHEVEAAVAAGAELVLSCNSTNLSWAHQLDAELVVIPDNPHDLSTMWETAAALQEAGTRYRLDPILEPIGFGFATSLARYYETRRMAPQSPIMMGVGNLTELSEVDSAGLNFLFAAICQELGIHSILTTQVANWCLSSVAEFDRARRLVKYAIDNQTPPKRLSHELVMLRDPRRQELGEATLAGLASQLKDPNYRIFVERGEIHVMNRDGYWHGTDPYELFDDFTTRGPALDAPHAFYLGYELSKAVTALTLGKQYQQDQALRWGFLTVPEVSAHERRRNENAAAEGEQS